MRNRKIAIFLTLGFLTGVCILLYPAFSSFWNSKTQSRVITDYESVLKDLDTEDYSAIFDNAHAYNRALYETDYPLLDYIHVPGYEDTRFTPASYAPWATAALPIINFFIVSVVSFI